MTALALTGWEYSHAVATRFARVFPFDWGSLTVFSDGSETPSEHHPRDFHYHVIAHRLGYGDDTARYAFEHDLAHLLIEEALHGRPSRVLWGLAHGMPLTGAEAAYEEVAAQSLQRWVRANERPIVGSVDWDALKARFLEVLG